MATIVRITGIVFGTFFLLLSLPLLIGGAVVLGLPEVVADDQGYMNSPTIHLKSDSYAFVTESFTMDNYNKPGYDKYNDKVTMNIDYGKIVNLRVLADSYFLGLASTSDVKHYLSNVSYEVVNQMSDQSVSTYTVNANANGSLSSTPSEQSFWLASGIGAVYYTPSNADFNKELTFVVMKADGTQGVDADVKIGVDLPILKPIGIGMLIFGSVFFVLTVTSFIIAYKSKSIPRNVIYFTPGSQQQKDNLQSESYYATPNLDQNELSKVGASKYCVNCGTQADYEAKFCESCGFSFK